MSDSLMKYCSVAPAQYTELEEFCKLRALQTVEAFYSDTQNTRILCHNNV